MKPANTIRLEFDPTRNRLDKGKALSAGLSAVARIGDTLWVANDETISLERLTLTPAGDTAGDHRQFSLADHLRLPVPLPVDPKALEEVDVEGLDYADGYLWLVGSHSLKRKQPKAGDSARQSRKRLETVEGDGNRYLIARIPVEDSGETFALANKTRRNDKELTAAQLRGDQQGNLLTESLREDRHLGPFLAIPGKDNGFDIEGLAAVGERLLIGLRGPVLRGWAVVLEVDVTTDDDDPTKLGLKVIGDENTPYRKHFLQLGGLGIRDLCVSGADLLILAGPSMDLDGPVAIFRWPGGAKPDGASIVPADQLERLLDVPYGRGSDRAEGMAWFSDDSQSRRMLVVYDAAADHRQPDDRSILADLFMLPAM